MCQTVERLLYSPKIDANSVSTSHNEKPWTRACVHIASKDSWNTTMRLSPNSWHLRNSTVIKNGFLLSEIMHRDLSAHIGQTALTRTGPVVGQVHHILVHGLSSPFFSCFFLFFATRLEKIFFCSKFLSAVGGTRTDRLDMNRLDTDRSGY